jgi:hypothetical protein
VSMAMAANSKRPSVVFVLICERFIFILFD